jgi:hypothetical protein
MSTLKPWSRARIAKLVAIILGVVALGGVIVVPEFRKYMRSAKMEEATEMLDLIKKGAVVYYTTPRTSRVTGLMVPCQFPASVARTPAVSCCDPRVDRDGDGRCDVNLRNWDDPT